MESTDSPNTDWTSEGGGRWSKFDQVSVKAAVLGGAGALALAASFADWGRILPYALIGILVTFLAALAALILRLVIFGRLPKDAEAYVPQRICWLASCWLVSKAGFAFASIYLFIAAGLGLLLGWSVGFLIEGAVLLIFGMMVGNFLLSCTINIALVHAHIGGRMQSNPNI